jgi:hypothetical protein
MKRPFRFGAIGYHMDCDRYDDTVETYTIATARISGLAVRRWPPLSPERLHAILSYDVSNKLLSLTGTYNRGLSFGYSGNR